MHQVRRKPSHWENKDLRKPGLLNLSFCPRLWFMLTKDALEMDLASVRLMGKARTQQEVPTAFPSQSHQHLSEATSSREAIALGTD